MAEDQDRDTLFLAIARERGYLPEARERGLVDTQRKLRELGYSRSLARVAQEEGFLAAERVAEVRAEMQKRGAFPRLGGYELVAKLGEGGMGTVYEARQLSLNRTVALKVLSPALTWNKRDVERFRREALLAAQIVHPNAVQVFDVGQADGHHFIVMEYVDGVSLERVVARGPLDEGRTLDVMRELIGALAVAHERGIIHRDIKPANILLSRTGYAKLADLGIARQVGAASVSVTQSGAAIGTPHYMSPEQCLGRKDLDARADLYSLGATLFHLLSGRTPYMGATIEKIMHMQVYDPVPDLRAANAAVSPGAAELVLRLMAKRREDRPQTCAAVISEIEGLRSGRAQLEAVKRDVLELAGRPEGAPMPEPPPATGTLRTLRPKPTTRRPRGAKPALRPRREGSIPLLLPSRRLIGAVIVGTLALAAAAWLLDHQAKRSAQARREAERVTRERREEQRLAQERQAEDMRQSQSLDKYRESEAQAMRLQGEMKWAEAASAWQAARRLGEVLRPEPPGFHRIDQFVAECSRRALAPVTRAPPPGFRAVGTTAEPYTGTGLPREIVHERTGIALVFVPAGSFTMGESGDAYRLWIDQPFYMGKYEVTQGEWVKVMGANPSNFKGDDRLPVELVSWNDCQSFLTKAGDGLRLPTEAEWEYACRAGTTTRFYSGDADASLGAVAWYSGNSGSKTHPVGGKQANAFGLYDMHGNVWEWCQSQYRAYPYRADDGREDLRSAGSRVVRGGAWFDDPLFCRSAFRGAGGVPSFRGHSRFGFRVLVVM